VDDTRTDATRTANALDDLEAIPRGYAACRALLTPGRERPPDWVQSDRAATEAARAAKADRAAKAYNAQHRITAVGAAPAPVNLAVLTDVLAAERLILGASATIRTRLGVTPIPGKNRPAERHTRLLAAIAWLARAGIHATTGDELAAAARDIARARHHLDRHADPADITIRVQGVPCPACDRVSLRVHPAPRREDSYVACVARACQSTWPYAVWGTLGAALGVDLAALAATA
jgi:hypothetical protein